ncbi:MAG TPA: alpha/beta fold hydrolase [Pyrinomonadaceae bacterium]
MKTVLAVFLNLSLLVVSAAPAFAQSETNLAGNWLATLDVGGGIKHRLLLKIHKTTAGYTAKFDSVDQGVKDLPVDSVTLNGNKMSFVAAQFGMSYEGTLNDKGDEVTGTFKQGAGSTPMIFRRVGEVPMITRRQDPKKPYPYDEEEVTIPAKGYTLAGTLLLPKNRKGKVPAVLTITGSGQQTRDSPVPFPGLEKYGIMRQIAEALAARGVAVLRVDDRGVGKSGGLETLANVTTSGFADDARAEVAFLRSRPEIDSKRIALVGHSEGGSIAPMLAASDPQIAAIVLLAGGGKRGDEISREQLADALERNQTLTAEQKNAERAKQEEIMRAVQTGADLSKYPAQARLPWVKEFWTYDPLVTIRKVRQPLLILQGALDRQITAEQADILERAARDAGNKNVTKQVFPTLNHLFLPAKTGALDEYSKLETSIIPDDVIKVLGDWLVKTLKVKQN